MSNDGAEYHRQWREYRTASDGRPVNDYLLGLPEDDRASILREMEVVRKEGMHKARHLRGEIYEVRATHDTNAYRVLFAQVGRFSQVLLSLAAFAKRTPRTPPHEIDVAEQRLAEWRRRGREKAREKKEQKP